MAPVRLCSCAAKPNYDGTIRLTIATALLMFAGTLLQAVAEPPKAGENAGSAYNSLSMVFESNQGQASPKARFLGRGNGYLLMIGDTETDLVFRHWNGCTAEPVKSFDCAVPEVVRMQLIGAQGGKAAIVAKGSDSRVHGEVPLVGKVNYLIGNDPAKWKRGLPTYGRVRVAEVYPGVDLVFYGNQRQLEWDFVLAPRANPDGIRLRLTAARIGLERNGDLAVSTRSGPIGFRKPFLYQEIDGVRRPVRGGFRVHRDSTVGFQVGTYDHSHPLVIDPILSYSTLLSGATIGAIAVDPTGNAYITGVAVAIPTTPGAFQSTIAARNYGGDAFVTKLNSTGTGLVYSTYLGGTRDVPFPGGPPPNGAGDGGSAIAIDGAGNAYLAGFTYSLDFPTKNSLQAQKPGPNDNAFVAELDSTGSGLVYSTYLGGGGCGFGVGDRATGIALDSSGAAYVVGTTCSRDFPVTASAFQPTIPTTSWLGGWGSGFVSKISAGGTVLEYSTYLAGPDTITSSGGIVTVYPGPTQANAVAVDSGGNAYVTGGTYSRQFPVTAGAFQANKASTISPIAFVAKLNSTGTALEYATYLGGTNGSDSGNAIAVDGVGNAYVTGSAGSKDFPVTPGAYQTTNKSASGLWNVFVSKLNPSGSALVYSTYLGGSGSTGHADPNNPDITNLGDSASGIAIDGAGNAYIAGAAGSPDFPVTTNAVQAVNHAAASGNTNAFAAELSPSGSELLYSSYLGGSGSSISNLDYAIGVALDGSRRIHLAGVANSADFPTTSGAFETSGNIYTANSFIATLDPGSSRRRHHHHEPKCNREESERGSERDRRGIDRPGCDLGQRDH